MIEGPKLAAGDPDRRVECEKALASEVFALLQRKELPTYREVVGITHRAKDVGWTSEEIADALHALGDGYIELVENAIAKRSVGWLIGISNRVVAGRLPGQTL